MGKERYDIVVRVERFMGIIVGIYAKLFGAGVINGSSPWTPANGPEFFGSKNVDLSEYTFTIDGNSLTQMVNDNSLGTLSVYLKKDASGLPPRQNLLDFFEWLETYKDKDIFLWSVNHSSLKTECLEVGKQPFWIEKDLGSICNLSVEEDTKLRYSFLSSFYAIQALDEDISRIKENINTKEF